LESSFGDSVGHDFLVGLGEGHDRFVGCGDGHSSDFPSFDHWFFLCSVGHDLTGSSVFLDGHEGGGVGHLFLDLVGSSVFFIEGHFFSVG